MEKKTDILVIGAGPAGVVSAVTAHKYYPDKKILVMKDVKNGVIPCGIPYMFFSLNNPDEDKLSTKPLEDAGMEVVADRALKIDRAKKAVETRKGDVYFYDKLILAIGSHPIIPPIPGIDKRGIYSIHKDMDYLKQVISEIKGQGNILIVGGGFIGVEFADEISRIKGVNTHLVELFPHLLSNSFDEAFSSLAEDKLRSKGVNVLTNTKVVEFLGDGKVDSVRFGNGEILRVDSVILGIGAVPNTKIASDAGLDIGKGRGIWVDEYMRTADYDIFAVGDCAGKRDFYTRRDVPVLLASTATAEARVAGASLYRLKIVRENKGTIAVYSTYLSGLVLGSAGLTEKNVKREGFEIITGVFEGTDKHPSTLPGASRIKVKLIFSKHSGIILGGQVAGGISCGELINLIGVAIQKRMSFTELETLQMATHPYLTSTPVKYPIALAAQDAAHKVQIN